MKKNCIIALAVLCLFGCKAATTNPETINYNYVNLEGEEFTVFMSNASEQDTTFTLKIFVGADKGNAKNFVAEREVRIPAGGSSRASFDLEEDAYDIPGAKGYYIYYGTEDSKSLHKYHVDKYDFTIHLIGDSTMASKRLDNDNKERGWGMYFRNCFKSNARVVNYAADGKSAKTFISEGRWARVVRHLKPGDYLFIELGHNDEKIDKEDKNRYAWGEFSDNLRMFVHTANEKGVHTVLLSPVARRWFGADGKIVQSHEQYPAAVEAVAKEVGVPYIDMNKATTEFIESLGDEPSKAYFMWLAPGTNKMYPQGREDNTHSVAKGAHKNCDIVCDSIRVKVPELAAYLLDKPYDYVVRNDGKGDFMTIQEAFDAAEDNATILVKQGYYNENAQIPAGKKLNVKYEKDVVK